MTRQRTIAGLQWQHYGPSFYTLLGVPQVEVAYLGDGSPTDPNQWFLFLEDHGDIKIQAFPTRDAACKMAAEAFYNGDTTCCVVRACDE